MTTIATIQSPRTDSGSSALPRNVHVDLFQRGLAISELDFKDNRYPSISASRNLPRAAAMMQASSNRQPWDATSDSVDGVHKMDSPPVDKEDQGATPEILHADQAQQNQNPKSDSALSYALPAGAARRVVERYSLDDNTQSLSKGEPSDFKEVQNDPSKSAQGSVTASQHPLTPPQLGQPSTRDIPIALLPANPRIGAGPSNSPKPSSSYGPNMGITIPISSSPRAFAQHPTFITPAAAPDPINPVFSPTPLPPPEEVCVECAMRDQDMADVDVTGPGVWDRESNVLYEELLRRELEEEDAGVVSTDSSKPRARGGRLTEQNLKIWLTMNPREPAARQQTLDQYIKSQRTLLEAEALAHARAMQESMQLESKMRDTYTQLRRSAYELGNSSTPVDDIGHVRIKAPHSPSPAGNAGSHVRAQSRELTLLENGMIVEHVDVRKEEKEERERRKKEEKRDRSRARKVSRGSIMDVTSLYSVHSLAPHTDSGLGLMPNSRYSAISSNRPTSSLAGPIDRQSSIPQAYSQASFSDVHSPGSASPRRTRFFGFRNLSSGWRSQDSLAPSGMSGSMVDMHVALQREANGPRVRSPADSGIRLPSQRQSQVWPPTDASVDERTATPDDKPKKKKNGLKKIWNLVKGSSNKESSDVSSRARTPDRHEDDLPLAPPPPLSYLVDRGPGEHVNGARHASTPSLPSTTSPRNPLSSTGMSPPTAPSSILPSPTSSRPSGADRDTASDGRKPSGHTEDKENGEWTGVADDSARVPSPKFVHPVTSEPDMRQKLQQADGTVMLKPVALRPYTLSREKSLPPLPGELKIRPQGNSTEPRPQTLYTYDARQVAANQGMHDLVPPHAPFRTEARRQSFSGITSRPNLGIQTLPITGGYDHLKSSGPYNEFGISRRSLGRLEHIDENPSALPTPSHKRKSKFGFAALLGRKTSPPEIVVASPFGSQEFPKLATPCSDGREESLATGYTHSAWRHSVNTKMSITSRKALEELVDQDAEFVAYRYPSGDQRFDLLR
ncbi:hypothetical protein SERLA73DRAFT_168083 [Serpula lacrymans var. lacrymans S7.3]|uniref:Proteophosphoglycan ppg4 n=2 Tax=Serpula lacrymans var. lacrymans TaxID=341189 RepID=F8PWH8_SERL3|nr:uncharacterized protein SERLADRAFT_448770 [Serpula lacrymans var. lacrymans S7.9]EGO00302.1 hypothetical protein SERLA73DRAFT_168083 [Serpula lacrymans var. lacrymans S7.3]EGO25862.1 hypothetical protein SERLADRAFT_448770 [Serpula lacrymans var. lacrymans S7.9]